MDERKVTSEGGDGLEEDRAPVKVSMSLSLSSSAKARRRKGSDGFLSAAPLGPKVHQQEAALEGDLDAEEKEHEGPSEFESYFQAEVGHGETGTCIVIIIAIVIVDTSLDCLCLVWLCGPRCGEAGAGRGGSELLRAACVA